jgi:amino acid adenylation domain-containing protein
MSSVVDDPASSVHQLFERQARRTPEATALIEGERHVSFGQLEHRANRLARRLRELGVEREVLVGLCLPHSAALVEAMLAILAAGGAYVPLDPTQPARAAAVLDDARPAVVVSDREHAALLPRSEVIVVYLDDLAEAETIAAYDAEPLGLHDPESLAHVLYTSGSTGKPKGVLGTHANELARLAWMHERFPYQPDEVGCLKTALSFIDSFSEIFWPLAQGAPLLCVPAAASRDPRQLVALLGAHGVTRLCAVPSLLQALVDGYPDLAERLPRLRLCFSCGEPLRTELASALLARLPDCRLFNLYGSTELTADVTCCEVDQQLLRRCGSMVPIGEAVAQAEVRVVDEQGRSQPPGGVGELWVGGPGVARGYLGQASGSAEGPFHSSPPTYRTGDLARLRDDGLLEIVGRVDQQLKIRGHRIEPGEVEAALLARPEIHEAVVVARREGSGAAAGPTQLWAYLVASPQTEPVCESTVRRELAARLPDYMVPARVLTLERLPRGPSGKLDRAALPSSPVVPATTTASGDSDRETIVRQIWQRVLGRVQIGAEESFFALGGDSLSALKMLLAVEAELGAPISQAFFEQPTIAQLLRLIERGGPPIEGARLDGAPTSSSPPVDWRASVPLIGPWLASRAALASSGPVQDPLADRVGLWLRRSPEKLAQALPFERGLALLRRLCTEPRAVELIYGDQAELVRRFFTDLGVADPDGRRLQRALLGDALHRRFEKATKRATTRREIAGALEAKGLRFWRPFTRLCAGREDSAALRELLAARYRLLGLEQLERSRRRGRGVIALSYHMPLFRLALPALYQLGFEQVELAAFSEHRVRAACTSDDPAVVAEHVASATAAFTARLYATLAAGGLVLMAGDGRKGRAHCEVTIGGRHHRLRAGFADLALRSGAVVLPLQSALDDDGRIALCFDPPMVRGPRSTPRGERARAMTQRFAAFFDHTLRSAPESLSLRRMAYHLALEPR